MLAPATAAPPQPTTQLAIHPAILGEYNRLNDDQRAVLRHGPGPLLVIAGPGSGKTFSLVLRTMNLFLQGQATPADLILCTFTEKAAFELRDRLADAARRLGYTTDLSSLRVGTINGLCNRLLAEYRHHTRLGNNFETLDDLTQLLFIGDHFTTIVGPKVNDHYLGRYTSKWNTIEALRDYFNKITEELVDPTALLAAPDPFLQAVGRAYLAYRDLLFDTNHLDFSHQQRLVYDLLQDPAVAPRIISGIRHVLVDEYQDTNYIQEQILLQLSSATRNLTVVGDEDQALYRFRGATVRNILEFTRVCPDAARVKLTTNYRSHERIVHAYDKWMASANWANPAGLPFRYDKTICPSDGPHADYPAVFAIWGQDDKDEAQRFADLVTYLKTNGIIQDYSQVALLLRSVKKEHSGPYLAALERHTIPFFCPRARTFFDNDEIRWMVGALALILGYHGDGRGALDTDILQRLAKYTDDCFTDLARQHHTKPELIHAIRAFAHQIEALQPDQTTDLRIADYFYRLLALEPFATLVKDENRARTLAIFSQLINTFQAYYHYNVVTYVNRRSLRLSFFNSFLRLLYDGGINDYEDPLQPIPKGYVQVMTIHQSKGLEFPVVVVGSLNVNINVNKAVDRALQPYYRRPVFEPETRVTDFDRMRLHYVAFSRAEKVLVLTTHGDPKPYFQPIFHGLRQWPYVRKDLLAAQRWTLKERIPIKRSYSFTGDLTIYETCPRHYQFFREYDFTPSRSAVIFFGLLVHQTIEEIHRRVLDGQLHTLNEGIIRGLFDRVYSFLTLADVRPIGPAARENAFRQVMAYFTQNQPELRRVIRTEVDVSLELPDYILVGKVDLLMGDDHKLEILDFKSSERPAPEAPVLDSYHRQLCTYAYILEQRYGLRAERLYLYWTAEQHKAVARQEFPYRPDLVADAGRHFDRVVKQIQAKEFRVRAVPERKVCKNCDLRAACAAERLITPFREDE